MLRAKTVFQFLLGIETFAAGAVVAAVFAEINISLVVNALEEGLNGSFMRGIGRPDELVVFYAQFGPQGLIFGGNAVHKLLRRLAGLGRGFDNLVSVFVRPREHTGIFSAHAVKTLERIRHKGGVGVPEVRPGVDIVNGGSDVEALHVPYS